MEKKHRGGKPRKQKRNSKANQLSGHKLRTKKK